MERALDLCGVIISTTRSEKESEFRAATDVVKAVLTEPLKFEIDLYTPFTGNYGKEKRMSTIEKSIEVNVPEYTAYAQWTKFAEFPQFMEGVKEVTQLDGKRFHWKAVITGQEKEWDLEITELVADQRLAWTSRGSVIKGWVVTFHRLSDARTKVMLQLEYDSQGVAEHGGEALDVVSQRVQGDLERFKALIEKRWRPAGRETIFDIAVGKTY